MSMVDREGDVCDSDNIAIAEQHREFTSLQNDANEFKNSKNSARVNHSIEWLNWIRHNLHLNSLD